MLLPDLIVPIVQVVEMVEATIAEAHRNLIILRLQPKALPDQLLLAVTEDHIAVLLGEPEQTRMN